VALPAIEGRNFVGGEVEVHGGTDTFGGGEAMDVVTVVRRDGLGRCDARTAEPAQQVEFIADVLVGPPPSLIHTQDGRLRVSMQQVGIVHAAPPQAAVSERAAHETVVGPGEQCSRSEHRGHGWEPQREGGITVHVTQPR
jgi:hypothetical protein